MEHGAVPLKDAHPRFEQCAVAGAGEGFDHGDIGGIGHQQAHIDPVHGRRAQGLHVGGVAGVVGVGQPEPLTGESSDELIETEKAGGGRNIGDDAEAGRPGRGDDPAGALLPGGEFLPGHRPDLGEGLFNVSDRGPMHLHPGIAPGLDFFGGEPLPGHADAEPGDVADLAVHRQHLAVVAREPAEGTIKARTVEAAHLNAASAQPLPEGARGLAESPQPVIDDPDAYSFSSLLQQGIGESAAGRIPINDITLEMDMLPGRGDRLQPGRIVFGCILEQADAVAGNEGRSSRS